MPISKYVEVEYSSFNSVFILVVLSLVIIIIITIITEGMLIKIVTKR